MEDVNTVAMPMHLNVIQYDPNDRLAIKKQNRISYAAYIGKLMNAIHAMRPSDPRYFGWVSREHTIQISDRRPFLPLAPVDSYFPTQQASAPVLLE